MDLAVSGWSAWEAAAVVISVCFLLYIWLCYENFHFHVTHLYAHLGYPSAQHIMGQRYLQGVGVQQDEERAMQWFRRASQQGHPHASYNVAVGKLRNKSLMQEDGVVEKLLGQAADQGLQEAQELLETLKRNRGPS
uniref:Sel1-repeat-containing protein YbeT-like isoform X1 n=1 Tax=Geotrypetes seraphini TaxID=260995 RepID=A0A6P8QZ18_GEOSA|nr:sel1-repeat-containing protein YbeT-like isoform X1 [Geotrypetes seraphini]